MSIKVNVDPIPAAARRELDLKRLIMVKCTIKKPMEPIMTAWWEQAKNEKSIVFFESFPESRKVLFINHKRKFQQPKVELWPVTNLVSTEICPTLLL